LFRSDKACFFTAFLRKTSLKWLRRGDLYFERFYCWKKQDLQAGGRRVNLFEPAGEFYAASLFLLRFLWRLTKNEEVRAAQDFAGFDFSENYVPIYKTRLY
jgi:hypothetical protein